MLTPAVRVPMVGYIPFFRVPTAGVLLIVLGVLTVSIAFRPHGWWRWAPGVFSGVVVAIAYWRIVHTPSGTFADVVLRRTVHPAWGFAPMSLVVVISLCSAALVRKTQQAWHSNCPDTVDEFGSVPSVNRIVSKSASRPR
jgi:hypothetical protein